MGILTSFTGKCNISCSGGSSEEFVSSYNNSSSIHFRYDNYGFIDEPIETFSDENTISSFQYEEIGPYADLPIGGDEISLDYGPVSKIRYATDDYGYISWTNNQAYGSFNTSGSAINTRYVPEHTGSGSLFTFVSKTETVAVSPDDTKVLFSINGTSKESIIPAPHIGSGSFSINQKTRLIGLDGKGQLVSAYTALIKRRSYSGSSEVSINGNAINTKYVPEHTGSGFFNVNGNATNIRYVPEHTGSGSLFTFVSKTESVTVSPDDTKVLFSINGACKESTTPTSYIGSGSVNIDGTSEESITPTPYIGSGSLVTFISKTETIAISPDDTKVLFSINGSASNIRFIPEYTGSGSLFGMGGSSNSVFYDYGVSQKVFKIFGSTLESFTRSNYNGVSLTAVEGQSLNRKIDFIPPKKPRLIVI